jgi:hypothetical protein
MEQAPRLIRELPDAAAHFIRPSTNLILSF